LAFFTRKIRLRLIAVADRPSGLFLSRITSHQSLVFSGKSRRGGPRVTLS
jgi:hypothetical protein